jgi:hypothetical protein
VLADQHCLDRQLLQGVVLPGQAVRAAHHHANRYARWLRLPDRLNRVIGRLTHWSDILLKACRLTHNLQSK